MRRRIGRSRLPPAPAMNCPVAWMSGTGDSISRPMAASMPPSSAPIATATRFFNRASSGVGAFTEEGRRRLPEHHPVLDLNLHPRGGLLHRDHRELVLDLHHP